MQRIGLNRGICIVDAFLAMSNSVSAMDRLMRFPNGTIPNVSQMDCFFKYYVIFLFFANMLVGISALLVSLERFVVVFFPLKYMLSYTRTKGILIMIGCVFFCVLTLFVAYIYQTSVPNVKISAMCYTAYVYPPIMAAFLVSVRTGTLGVSILLYLPITLRICQIKLRSRKHVVHTSSTHSSTHRLAFQTLSDQKKNIKFTVTIGLTCVSTLMFLFIPDLIINFNIFQLQSYHILFYRASLLKAVINLFIYTLRHRELRKELMLKLFYYHCG
ncbi:hypothetical protein L596_016241 [Steinernema carpocapsae]|uniref:G-protein coupled receptors family 1 profile domain-containing protein n=1 Tax=Steinernema carpocapsae TaxID=34508 RepID=A0A4U5NHE6_STECR|nr:hypothetical protein L596_016241 [Steinernema carpocapsae]